MPKTGKRLLMGRGKGYLSAAGAQYRFIFFLLVLLIAYTFLLRVFQKLAEIVQFPVFFPIALVTLLVFVGIVGIVYSHTFVGPLVRLRNAISQLADGETNITLRLREADDSTLKDLAAEITRLGEQTRETHAVVEEAAQDLIREVGALRESVNRGAGAAEIRKHLDLLEQKQNLMNKALESFGKA